MKMPSDRAVKEELINNVLDKVMSNHLTKLTAGGRQSRYPRHVSDNPARVPHRR